MRFFRNESPVQNGHLVQRRYDFYGDDTVRLERGYHLSFDGVDDEVTRAHTTSLDFGTGDLSFELFLKISDAPESLLQILDKGGGVGRFWLQWDRTRVVCNSFFGGAHDFSVTASPELTDDGLVHHVAVTCDRDGLQKFYVDGELGGSIDISAAATVAWDSSTAFRLCSDQQAGARLACFQDGIRLYARLLSDAEIAQHALLISEQLIDNTDLRLLWNFDTGSGTKASDDSINNNHGTISGASWVSGNL